jgi:hypothetical protein
MGLPLDSHANDADIRARWAETDARIHAMIAAEEARRVPQAQAAEWAAYARRHNTVHPDELAARIARGQQARADDWQQGTVRFQRPTGSLAEKARASRAQQRRPVMAPMSEHDMDELEPPTMIEGNVLRSGYRHANAYR